MSSHIGKVRDFIFDKSIILILFMAFMFNLNGIQSGIVECWNPDQMAFRSVRTEGKFLNPENFLKPPFHTYLSFFMCQAPLKVAQKVIGFSPYLYDRMALVCARLLTSFLFLGSVALLYTISRRSFGRTAALVIATVAATSAGFIAFSHFLTADIPLLFWMIAAFYFAHNIMLEGKWRDYVLAGFLTGIATATKYNGLAVGIAIPLAHALSLNRDEANTVKRLFLSKNLLLGLTMVCAGFIVGNPYALLDYSRFAADFYYNYSVTPVYGGVATGHTYWSFFKFFVEILGYPSTVIFTIAVISSVAYSFKDRIGTSSQKTVLLCLCTFLLYYLKFGAFPRMETRFVLPVIPFFLLMSGPFWARIQSRRAVISLLLIAIIPYNIISSYYVGMRFKEEPRMKAIEWVKEHVPESSSIEVSPYSPRWNKTLPDLHIKYQCMPFISGRGKLFGQMFSGDTRIQNLTDKFERQQEDNIKWYSLGHLLERDPDFIVIDSNYYQRFLGVEMYPEIGIFFKNLLNETYPYKIVFDQSSEVSPRLLYPKEIDFLQHRVLVFKKY